MAIVDIDMLVFRGVYFKMIQSTYIDPTGKGVQLSRPIKSPLSDSVEDLT